MVIKMKYHVLFLEDPTSCVWDEEFEAENESELQEKCNKFVDEVLAPKGIVVGGASYRQIK